MKETTTVVITVGTPMLPVSISTMMMRRLLGHPSQGLGHCRKTRHQQRLQFFSDKARALNETRRILKDGGRIGLSVWGRREDNPYFHAIDAVVCRYLGEKPAARLRVPHSMAGPGEVRALLEGVGFRQVDVRLRTLLIHTPPARDYLPNHLNAMPVAEELGALPETARSDLFEDLLSSLSRYMDGDKLRVPCTVQVCSAVR